MGTAKTLSHSLQTATPRPARGKSLPRYDRLRDCHRFQSASSIQQAMSASQFQEILEREFESRRQRNPRYSLRAFAAFLETDHSTLSQILRDKRRIPIRQLRSWARKLGMTAEEVAAFVAAQHVPDQSIVRRQEQLRHWTAEALAIVTDRAHWQIVHLSRSRGFQQDCRWVASQLDVTVDQVNVILSRLLRLRLLEIGPAGRWKCPLGREQFTEAEFNKRALTKVRELAAGNSVELPIRAIRPRK